MLLLRKTRFQRKTIAWWVIVAVVTLTLAPHHYHLHHGAGSGSATHEHEIDLHLFADISDAAHHDEAIVLEATPDGLTKPLNDSSLILLLTVSLLALLPIVDWRLRHRMLHTATHLRPAFYHLIPPLRAPPRLQPQ